jgi:hypothetical protein
LLDINKDKNANTVGLFILENNQFTDSGKNIFLQNETMKKVFKKLKVKNWFG